MQEKIDEAKKATEGKVDEATGGSGSEAWKGIQSYLETAVPGAKDVSTHIPLYSLFLFRESDRTVADGDFVDPRPISSHSSRQGQQRRCAEARAGDVF